MNMDEHKNHINNRLSEQLPSHSPDPGAWHRLSEKLDVMDVETAYQERLQGLPVHSPDQGTWNAISSRLTRIAYYRTGIRIALSAAAGLLLFFTVSKVSDTKHTETNISEPQLAKQEQLTNPSAASLQSNPGKKQVKAVPETRNYAGISSSSYTVAASNAEKQKPFFPEEETQLLATGNNPVAITALHQEALKFEAESAAAVLNSGNIVAIEIPDQSENSTDQQSQGNSSLAEISPVKETIKTDIETRSILFQKEPYPAVASTSINAKQISPPASVTASNKNHVALDMNYLPENIYNGTDNSLFHNIDLTASYNKQKVRFNTSLGMAYNEEQLQFNMSYDINTPVTAMGPGGKVDTLSYNLANMESEYLGTEKHKYVTYNLGIGRRIFKTGKFSTWFNAGAGFGVQLDNPDLITTTTNSVKTQYNAQRVSVSSSKPVYNDVNINFVTAIDFNYMIISKLSITFTPTSRWYFKPVMTLNNQATDELTLGFRAGLKFDF
jgi:hypothetical protein